MFCLLCLAISAFSGAGSIHAEEGAFKDDRYEFGLTAPKPWSSAALSAYRVPGVCRAAWSGPGNASIVAFVQEPGKAISPRFLVDASADSMEKALNAKVTAREVKTVAGMKAMWLVATAPGTGGALTGKGDIETTQHWVAVPREKDIVVILLTCPSADYAERLASFEMAIKSLEVKGTQTPEQAEAK